MRQRVEDRTAQTVRQHLLDLGFLRTDDLEQAQAQGVDRFVPPKPAMNPRNRGQDQDIKPGDTLAVRAWKRRMASQEGQEIYKEKSGDQGNRECRPAMLSRVDTNHGARPAEDKTRGRVVRGGLQRDALGAALLKTAS